jgi:hypothetical protein
MTNQLSRPIRAHLYLVASIFLGNLGFFGSASVRAVVACDTVSAGADATITANCVGLILNGAGNVVVNSGVTIGNPPFHPAVDVTGSSNSFQNTGAINSDQLGLIVESSVNLQTLTNGGSATILVNGAAPQVGGIGLYGSVGTINNSDSAQISAIRTGNGVLGAIGSYYTGVLGTLNNSGSAIISAEGSGSTGRSWTGGVVNGGMMSAINNTGSARILGVDSGTADVAGIMSAGTVLFSSLGTIGSINNSGSAQISGTSTGLGDAFGVLNDQDIIGTIANTGSARIIGESSAAGFAYGIGNSGTINSVSNSELARISAVATGTGQAIGIYNDGILGSVTNGGMIDANSISNDALGISNYGGTLNTVNNTGTVTATSESGSAYGVENTGTFGNLNNSGSATISAITTGAGIAYGISNAAGGTITTIINSGSAIISGQATGAGYSMGIDNYGTIGTINNSGSAIISGSSIANWAYGIENRLGANISSINNAGTISATTTGIGNRALAIENRGAIGTLTNSGSIVAANSNANNSIAISAIGNSSIGTLNNSGRITAGNNGIYRDSNSTIGTLINTGSITGGTGAGSSGIFTQRSGTGSINTVINSQGGNSATPATTALTYIGKLPVNYQMIINSTTSYGQLAAVDVISGSAAFSFYGSNNLLTSRLYTGVLQGLTTANVGAARSGTYDNMTWTLGLESGSLTAWDLTFTGASLIGTQQSLVNTANALAPVYALQNAVLVNSFTYDCTLFDVNNICISVGGRNTQVSAANGLNNTSALLIAAYRPHPNYRIGAYADQNLSVNNAGSTVNLSNNTPLIGIFGAWIQNQEGTGAEVRVSAAYGQKDATITRQVVGLSEPGSGSSTLNSQGAQVTAKYGFGVMDKVIVSPYVGVRYTQNNMAGYTEGASSTVTAPLSYSALNTNATTALAGVGASYQVIPTVTTFASAGVETDTNTSNGSYSATGINGLTPVNFNPNPVRTRPTATVGAYYDIVKNQRFGVTGIYRQEAYQAVSSTTVMATYTIGL